MAREYQAPADIVLYLLTPLHVKSPSSTPLNAAGTTHLTAQAHARTGSSRHSAE